MTITRLAPSTSGSNFRQRGPRWPVRLLMILCGLSAAPAQAWDVSPSFLDAEAVKDKIPGTAALHVLGSPYTFRENTPVRLACGYTYGGSVVEPPPWKIRFTVDGKTIGEVPAQTPTIVTWNSKSSGPTSSHVSAGKRYRNTDFTASITWKASGSGSRTVQCELNPGGSQNEDSPHNNITQITVNVKPSAPLAAGDLPAVDLLLPGGNRFGIGPATSIGVLVKIKPKAVDGEPDFLAYTQASPFEERWHIEIVRSGKGGFGAYESPVGEFSGPVKTLQQSIVLTSAWLGQHNAGPGKYRARAYLSQSVRGVNVTGPNDSIEFELTAPETVNRGLAPAATAMPAPGKRPLPTPPVPATRAGTPVPTPQQPADGTTLPGRPAPVSPAGTATRQPATAAPATPVTEDTHPPASRMPGYGLPTVRDNGGG